VLTSVLFEKEKGTKIEDLLTRLCQLRGISLDDLKVLNDKGEKQNLNPTVGEEDLMFLELLDKKQKQTKENTKEEEDDEGPGKMQLGKPDDIKATVGTPCAYSLREQLFPQEWQALQDLKTNYEICKNYSDEFLMACLFARKLDLIRTHNLLQQNMRWRKENGFLTIPKLSEINQEVFSMWGYVPGARSKEGTGILYFHLVEMGKEPFTANNIIKFLVWHNFVGGFSEGMDFYRNGVFILRDMGQFTWKHVDVDIMKKVNTMWTDNFPTRVKKFIALDPPAIFEALKK